MSETGTPVPEPTREQLLQRIKLMLDLTSQETICSACLKPIWFLKMRATGKSAPFTSEGLNHFADCPARNRFRRAK